MNFNVIASGSSGNCYFIDNNGHFIFVDAGATLTSIRKGLENRKPDKEKGASLFITHEHTDHISGVLPLISCYNPKIYTSKGTAAVLAEKGVDPEIIYTIDANITYEFADFTVMPFNTMHDAVEPFGFKFEFGDKVVSIATDFGIVTDELFKAIEKDDSRSIRALINRGANINAKDGYGLSALHLAIKNNSIRSVNVLLANKNIDLESKLPEGYFTHLGEDSSDAVYIGNATPLIYAIFKSKGDSRIVNELIRKGASVNATDEEGWTTFLYAAAFGNSSMLRNILSKNKNLINSKTKNNVTPLHMAVVYDNLDNIKYLVRNLKVDINAKDDDGWTALHFAAASDSYRAVEILLKNNADANIADIEGKKPVDITTDTDIKELLNKYTSTTETENNTTEKAQ